MNHSITWIVGAILIAFNFFGNTMAAVVPENEEALKTVSDGINHFAANFYKTSSDEESDNLICSPLSADIVLSMTSYGAGGNTKEQMRSALHIPANDEVGKKGFQSLIDNLNSLKKVELRLAQKIFMQNGIVMKPDFKDTTENYFRSTAETLDFSKSEEASQTINNWCSEKTNNRIKKVVEADDIKDASMVLVNAVYFKGYWNYPFKGYNTSPRPFHVDESTTKDVDMMYQEHSFNYGALPDLDAIFVELPYESENENDATSMFIILPNTITGLKKLEESLYKINFKELHDNEHRTLMHLEMPKFKIESTLQLQTILEKLGMTDMFQSIADFKGITDDPPLKISKVIQKAFIEVNEKGSEAAAVTAVVAVPMSLPIYPVKPIRVNVDRPFAYVLHHIATNTILFQGHIKLPRM
ncbi:leukocyte elastase inhibitor-like [Microplitis demolitor]|uniref:leukocyte elastase inhibitor-like n=1 Tax=Microplitis demolitor TaxID=69319 RepID=UPI00235B6698|nr:leukocyte elastase inhibitor-like [Microplitis demolitor]